MNEHDAKTKKRMLLILNIVYHSLITAQLTRGLHRNKAWTSYWLQRHDKKGAKDRTKSGRPREYQKR